MKTPAWKIWLHIPVIAAQQWFDDWQDRRRSRMIDRSVRRARADGACKDLEGVQECCKIAIGVLLTLMAWMFIAQLVRVATGRG